MKERLVSNLTEISLHSAGFVKAKMKAFLIQRNKKRQNSVLDTPDFRLKLLKIKQSVPKGNNYSFGFSSVVAAKSLLRAKAVL